MVALLAAALLAPAPVDAGSALWGRASWYRAPWGTAAAGPALRAALGPSWRGRRVRVCRRSRCITVRLTTSCKCYRGTSRERAIDLSTSAFRQLAPLSLGVITVTVRLP